MSAPTSPRDPRSHSVTAVHAANDGLPALRTLPIWYDASPVWLVNLPAYASSVAIALASAALLAILSTFTRYWVAGVWLPLVPLARLAGIAADTAAVRVVIDPLRLTLKTGIGRRRVASVELYRIVNVDAVTAWWERPLGFGTLVLETSDSYRPVWILKGVRHVERMRDVLTRQALELRAAGGVREVNVGRL